MASDYAPNGVSNRVSFGVSNEGCAESLPFISEAIRKIVPNFIIPRMGKRKNKYRNGPSNYRYDRLIIRHYNFFKATIIAL